MADNATLILSKNCGANRISNFDHQNINEGPVSRTIEHIFLWMYSAQSLIFWRHISRYAYIIGKFQSDRIQHIEIIGYTYIVEFSYNECIQSCSIMYS
jgi:hypothetical protein